MHFHNKINTIASRQKLRKLTYTKKQREEYKIALRKYKNELKSGEWRNKPYNEFLDLVKDRPDSSINIRNPQCPICDSNNVVSQTSSQTCLGIVEKYDLNTYTCTCKCNFCNFDWTLIYNGVILPDNKHLFNAWYLKNEKILKGIPTVSFGHYLYTCKYCGGDVKIYHFDKNTRNEAKMLIYETDGKTSFDIVFLCQKCKKEIYSSTDYYEFSNPFIPTKPFRGFRWTVEEETGICTINDYRILRLFDGFD